MSSLRDQMACGSQCNNSHSRLAFVHRMWQGSKPETGLSRTLSLRCMFSNRSSFLSAETWESSLRSLQDAAAEDPDKILASIQLQTVALL